jgi:DNA polymerase-3 subunit delta
MAKASTRKPGRVDGLDFTANPEKYPVSNVCAIYGDEAFLKHEALVALRRRVLGGDDSEFCLTFFTGKETNLREVLDALAAISLFGGGRRMVVVEEADSFVTQYRAQLEDYVTHPAAGGVLVLDVRTWPGNTRLAKALAADGLAIECRSADAWEPAERKSKERQLKTWLAEWVKREHGVRLEAAAGDALLELVPPEPGILVQELEKIVPLAGDRRTIDAKLVRDHVGGWRARTTWDMIDAAADGRAADALAQLDRLIAAGEKPQGLLPQIASSLRRFAISAELIASAEARRTRIAMRDALKEAGVPHFKLSDAERQLRQIGRSRARELNGWLLAADLAVKGHNASNDRARIELERLIVRLSATAQRSA